MRVIYKNDIRSDVDLIILKAEENNKEIDRIMLSPKEFYNFTIGHLWSTQDYYLKKKKEVQYRGILIVEE